VESLGGFNPQDVQQYLQGVSWPADKEQVAQAAESNGAPGPLVDQLRQRLPEGEFSGPQEVVSGLQGGG
jgi:hypothetical protein